MMDMCSGGGCAFMMGAGVLVTLAVVAALVALTVFLLRRSRPA